MEITAIEIDGASLSTSISAQKSEAIDIDGDEVADALMVKFSRSDVQAKIDSAADSVTITVEGDATTDHFSSKDAIRAIGTAAP